LQFPGSDEDGRGECSDSEEAVGVQHPGGDLFLSDLYKADIGSCEGDVVAEADDEEADEGAGAGVPDVDDGHKDGSDDAQNADQFVLIVFCFFLLDDLDDDEPEDAADASGREEEGVLCLWYVS
jgi:hypothetical protein